MFYFCSMPTEAAQLDQMREVAFGLGMSFGQAAQAEDDLDRKLALFDAFHRSFASVRLSIALKMRLAREAHAPPRVERPETERLEVERAEGMERPERYDERDRDRETERASFPLLLRTLSRVADDAQALLPEAAELPSLRELLAQVKAQPAAEPRPAATALRTRLAGSATTQVLIRPPAPPGPPRRRSTGPP
jgi:hypothetical protein